MVNLTTNWNNGSQNGIIISLPLCKRWNWIAGGIYVTKIPGIIIILNVVLQSCPFIIHDVSMGLLQK